MKKVTSKIIYSILILMIIGLYSFILYDQYCHATIREGDLEQVQEIFESYSKNRSSYVIHCKNGNKYRITKILIKEEELNSIVAGDELFLEIRENEIIVISVNERNLISLEECHSRYNHQIKITIIVISIMAVVFILLAAFFLYFSKKKFNLKRSKNKMFDNEKLHKEILDSIHQENGIYRCDILEKIEDDDSEYTLYCVLKEFLNEDELVFMIDHGGKDDILALIFYRLKDNISFEQIFREEDGVYEVDDRLFWWYPSMEEATKKDQEKYRKAIEIFNLNSEGLIKINHIK